MPKMTTRERLAKLEADQRALAEEAEQVRQSVRANYGAIAADHAVETMTEREFRDLVSLSIKVGATPALAALKALADPAPRAKTPPERRPSDEHGGAAHRRPASQGDAASGGDGPGQ